MQTLCSASGFRGGMTDRKRYYKVCIGGYKSPALLFTLRVLIPGVSPDKNEQSGAQ